MIPVITIVILIFGGIVILILAHVCMVEYVFRRGRRGGATGDGGAATEPRDQGSTSMSKEDVEKLPCFDFISKEVGSPKGSPLNCAVCLEHFKEGEKCRMIPICSHSFHSQCVDAWLVKIPSCPICRSRADSSRFDPGEVSSGHFSGFSLSNMESQATESSRFSDTRSEHLQAEEDPSNESTDVIPHSQAEDPHPSTESIHVIPHIIPHSQAEDPSTEPTDVIPHGPEEEPVEVLVVQ